MTSTLLYVGKKPAIPQKVDQPKWQRIILLFALGYEAAGCLLGGGMLVAEPDGRLMDMPVDIMHGIFTYFLVPGILLFGLGILNTLAFIAVLRKTNAAWITAMTALGGLLTWFWVEIAILQQLHWLHAMWGLPVIVGGLAAISLVPQRETSIQKALLLCGMLSSLLYVAINIIVPLQWKTYDPAAQTISELSAIDAPTRILWMVLSTPYTLLMLAFAWGVWRAAAQNRRLRIAGALLIVYGALGILWPFAPMHLRETLAAGGGSFSDTLHITLGVVTEVIYLLALYLAATALGKSFRLYSIATFLIVLVLGILTFRDAPGIAANQPTPMIGVWERVNIGIFLLWVAMLSGALLHTKQPSNLLQKHREKPDQFQKGFRKNIS